MSVKVGLIANCDDAVVFWRSDRLIEDCWGYSIEKEQKLPGGTVEREVLENRTGFKADDPQPNDRRPSTAWPFQRVWWADYSANLGDQVRYRVCPVVSVGGSLQQLIQQRSDWTPWTQLTGKAADGYSSFFNRGLVISQFMARYLEALRRKEKLKTRKEALKVFKASLADHEVPIRRFLSGALRTQLLELLQKAKAAGLEVYGALYELEDEELITALAALKKKAHVVLANGSITPRKGESAAVARKRDQNAHGRKALRDAKVDVHDRFISPGALGHNKFLVTVDGSSPKAVWTGSTNWTTTGLCTQINNGLLVRDGEVAQVFLDQWHRLQQAGAAFPKELVEANSLPAEVKRNKTRASIWFTRSRRKADLESIEEAVREATKGVLFLMFQPGGKGTLAVVRELQKNADLYVRGVVSTPPAGEDDPEDASEVNVTVVADKPKNMKLDIVKPVGIRTPFASWAATVTRDEFIKRQGGVIGSAIVHSKLIVVDPFTRPIVITGSHNFSSSASVRNDENFLIIRGNKELARHYAAHVLAVYHHYRWLAYVDEMQRRKQTPKAHLRETDQWQRSQFRGAGLRELDFWLP